VVYHDDDDDDNDKVHRLSKMLCTLLVSISHWSFSHFVERSLHFYKVYYISILLDSVIFKFDI
jgi:hypothetical protein